MFSFKVDTEISIELLQQHHKKELFELIDRPERSGFVKEGITRDGQWLYDHYED